ncbi:MAG: MGMT family protein [Thermoplasmata archaeon]
MGARALRSGVKAGATARRSPPYAELLRGLRRESWTRYRSPRGRSSRPKVGRSALASLRAVLLRVPRGKVATYGQIAATAGYPGAARLTVWALHGVEGLPWHRIVAAGGRIALPGELGHEQRLRLALEGVTFRAGRVRMELHNWTPRPRQTPRRPDPPRRRPTRS